MPDRGHRRTLLWRDQHDASLRKAKISAASALLSADVDDVSYISCRILGGVRLLFRVHAQRPEQGVRLVSLITQSS